MRIRKRDAAPRQPIEVRRLHLRMPAEGSDPVVQIVYDDDKDVRPLRVRAQQGSRHEKRRQERKDQLT